MSKRRYISKTLFFNLIRCPLFAPFFELKTKKENAIIGEIKILENLEKQEIINDILDKMFGDGDDFILTDANIQTETFQQEYKKVEEVAYDIICKKFPEKINSASINTSQYKATASYEGYDFLSYVDIFLETKDEINIFEVKATTTSKLYKKKKVVISEDKKGIKSLNSKYFDSFSKPFDDFKYFYDIAFQRFVLEHSETFNLEKKKVNYYVVLLNSEYHFSGKRENGENVYDDNIIVILNANDITDYIIKTNFQDDLKKVIQYLDSEEITLPKISKNCLKGHTRECQFFKLCKEKLQIPDKDSLYTLCQYQFGFPKPGEKPIPFYDVINENKYHNILECKDLIDDFSKAYTIKRQTQIKAIEQNKVFKKQNVINAWIERLKYPIYHLDFESLNLPLPRFIHEKPYTQSVFQFSIHIEKKPAVCDFDKDNISYLANSPNDDEREELVKKLVDTIKNDGGSVMVYNASFEKGRLQEFGEYFPNYKPQLDDIIKRIVDLRDIFFFSKTKAEELLKASLNLKKEDLDDNYIYYDRNFQGKTTIKIVYPTLTKGDAYSKMTIKNGILALTNFFKSPTFKGEKLKKYRQDALKYCMQDTYSMFEILKVLRSTNDYAI